VKRFRHMEHQGAAVVAVLAGRLISDPQRGIETILGNEVRAGPRAVGPPPSRDALKRQQSRMPELPRQFEVAALKCALSHHFESQLISDIDPDMIVGPAVRRHLTAGILKQQGEARACLDGLANLLRARSVIAE